MGRKEKVSREQLGKDAANTPDIAQFAPVVALQDDLWSPVLPSVYDRAVLLGLVGRAAEVDELDLCCSREAVVCESLVLYVLKLPGAEEDVLRLQVSVRVLLAVHEANSLKQLPRKALHVSWRIAVMPILADDIVERGSQWLKDHAKMPMVIEGLPKPYDMRFVIGISLVESPYDVPLHSR